MGIFTAARIAITLRQPATAAEGPAGSLPQSRSLLLLREYIDAVIIAGLFALFLLTFVLRTFYIPSASMMPTLQERDVLLVNEFAYRTGMPRRGDIVVFTPPIPSSSNFIKRVIAVPGDTLAVRGGKVYVNGVALSEPYIAEPPAYELAVKHYTIYVDRGQGAQALDRSIANIPPRSAWQADDRLPKGYYFVMGDNRNDSDDSHIWGFAQLHGPFASGALAKRQVTAQFTGRAFSVVWPLSRLRILK